MLDQATVMNAVHSYAKEVARVMSPAAIVFYGSYANGMANEDSDIDIAVIFNNFQGDWLKTSAALWGLTENISTYIEPILLDNADDPSGFVREVMKTGQVVYTA